MGVRSKSLNSISIRRAPIRTGHFGNVIDRYEFKEFDTAERAEIWANQQLGIPVEYDGLTPEEANIINKVIFEEFNERPLAPINLTGIYTIYNQKNPLNQILVENPTALMAIAVENAITSECSFYINVDKIAEADGSEYKQGKIDDSLEDLKNQKLYYQDKWKIYSENWVKNPDIFQPGEYLGNLRDYQSCVADVDERIKQVEKLKEMGVHRWGSSDYGDDHVKHLEMVILHEIGHLRHMQMFPETMNLMNSNKSNDLAEFMKGCKPFSMYANWTGQSSENFAEHYSLYRGLPHVLKKKSPQGYKNFEKEFKKI